MTLLSSEKSNRAEHAKNFKMNCDFGFCRKGLVELNINSKIKGHLINFIRKFMHTQFKVAGEINEKRKYRYYR